MGSVSSLTATDSDLGGDQSTTHSTPRDPPHGAASGSTHLLAPGNNRLSAGAASSTPAAANSSSLTPGTSSFYDASTLTPLQTTAYTSSLGDVSPSLLSSAEKAANTANHGPKISDEFVQGFLSDHMSVLQARIEETMQKLGLEKEST